MAQTARISEKSDKIIEELHLITGKSKLALIEIALKEYLYQERMRLYNEAYAKMYGNTQAWEEEKKDREELEGSLIDGLEDE